MLPGGWPSSAAATMAVADLELKTIHREKLVRPLPLIKGKWAGNDCWERSVISGYDKLFMLQ